MQTDVKVRACLISYHYDEQRGRPNLVKTALSDMVFIKDVHVLASNFDHIRKASIRSAGAGVTRLPVRPYPRNISLARILSYWDFTRQVGLSPLLAAADIVYICVPDYVSALHVLRWRKGTRPKVVIDVVDIWPEALPLPGLVSNIVRSTLWKGMRNLRQRFFASADLVLFQSQYFLSNYAGNSERNKFLPMCLPEKGNLRSRVDRPALSKEIRVLFLGSINSITDIASLVQIVALLAAKRMVRLSVVGGGSGLEYLKQQLRTTPVLTTFHGITFDVDLIQNELAAAHFGYNGYKESTEVAVSYKSLEYLQHGLPLINSAKGDTFEIVRCEGCGVNFKRDNLRNVAIEILSVTDEAHERMCKNARRAFDENFSYQRFSHSLEDYMGRALRTISAEE